VRLHDYLGRIGINPPVDASAETLRRAHRAHRETFLFENLAIQRGSRISLALADLERKFLDERQGGYCFEHNTLFAAALGELGIGSTALLGRVRRGPPAQWGRTHMVLRVPIGDRMWLADVGFGAQSLIEPIPLVEGATARQLGLRYTLRRERELWILTAQDRETTFDLYEFSEDPQTPTDIEIANHYTATHPDSVFRRTLTIQRVTAEERITLRGDILSRSRNGQALEERVDRSRLSQVVRDVFGIELPEGPFVSDGYPHHPQDVVLS
jgi:N-hydroxyarylamine O-acetyltransferase